MLREDAGPDVKQRYTRVRGEQDDAGAADQARLDAERAAWPAAAPPGVPRMSNYLRDVPLARATTRAVGRGRWYRAAA
jgi:hypothetical protein